MGPEFWRQRWERGQIGWHEGAANRHLRRHLHRLVSGSEQGVLVPLCGKSADLTCLSDHFERVVGVELVGQAIEAYFAERALVAERRVVGGTPVYEAARVSVVHASIFEVTAAHTGAVDRVFDRAALVALPREDRRRYVPRVLSLLPRGGRVLLVSRVNHLDPSSGPPFSVSDDEVRDLYGDACDLERLAVEPGDARTHTTWLATKR